MTGQEYINATPQEKEAWIQAYIARRKETYANKRPRYNGEGRGRAPKGRISTASSLRKTAREAWTKRRKRAIAKMSEGL